MRLMASFCVIAIFLSSTAFSEDWQKRQRAYEADQGAATSLVGEISGSMPKISAAEMKEGKFIVRDSPEYYKISYKLKGKDIYSGLVNKKGARNIGHISTVYAEGYSALFLNVLSGKFQFMIYPSLKVGRFVYAMVGDEAQAASAKIVEVGPAKTREIVTFERISPGFCAKYGVVCTLPRIIQASPTTGELFDVDDKYPAYIIPFINRCKRDVMRFERAAHRSDEWECKNWIDGYVNSAEGRLKAPYALRPAPPSPPPPPPQR